MNLGRSYLITTVNTKSDSKCNFKITLAPFLCAEVVNVFGRAAELLSGNAQDISLVQINFHLGPFLYYVSKETGWVGSENDNSLLTFSKVQTTDLTCDVIRNSLRLCFGKI